jgi:Fe-S-cluster containining protein
MDGGKLVDLHTPAEINYECTACGRCCGSWAVPLTGADHERIASVDWGALDQAFKGMKLFAALNRREREGTAYTHKIEPTEELCPFLKDNLCFIHSQRGAAFKPAICQLFPYCFTVTPSGVYATVSFVSAGAALNAGRPLSEQHELLTSKWEDFSRLYPDYKPDWSYLKLTVGNPITWEEYLQHEEVLLACLRDGSGPINERLLSGSRYLAARISNPSNTASAATSAATSDTTPAAGPLKELDQHLLAFFHKMYFPARPQRTGEVDFSIWRFVVQKFLGSTRFPFPGQSYSLAELAEIAWPDDRELDDLLFRYMLSSVYGKKYFGAGFGNVSLIAGFHHLVMVHVLIKLHARGLAKLRGATAVSMMDAVAAVRQMERQLGETRLGGYSAAAFELLFYSAGRAERLLAST